MTTPFERSFQTSTQVKTGEATPSLPVVAAHAPPPTAYQRAPTLMAGATAGAQGQVRVWSPNPWRHWSVLAAACLATAAGFGLIFIPVVLAGHPGILAAGFILESLLLSCFTALYQYHKLCYLTADEAGIGVTTLKGGRALKWFDIGSAAVFSHFPVLTAKSRHKHCHGIILQSTGMITLNLAGYTDSERHEILALIVERARLVQDSRDLARYRRPPAAELPDRKLTWLEPHRH